MKHVVANYRDDFFYSCLEIEVSLFSQFNMLTLYII